MCSAPALALTNPPKLLEVLAECVCLLAVCLQLDAALAGSSVGASASVGSQGRASMGTRKSSKPASLSHIVIMLLAVTSLIPGEGPGGMAHFTAVMPLLLVACQMSVQHLQVCGGLNMQCACWM